MIPTDCGKLYTQNAIGRTTTKRTIQKYKVKNTKVEFQNN